MSNLTMIQACDRALDIISRTREIERLYQKALKCYGEGRLRSDIMDLAAGAVEDEKLCSEVFASNESIVSFLCGIWLRFLLVEVAGVKKENLKALAQKAFPPPLGDNSLH